MKLKDLIDFGVNPDKVQVTDLPMVIDDRGFRILLTQTFELEFVDEINDSDGIYINECDDPPKLPDKEQVYLIRYCSK